MLWKTLNPLVPELFAVCLSSHFLGRWARMSEVTMYKIILCNLSELIAAVTQVRTGIIRHGNRKGRTHRLAIHFLSPIIIEVLKTTYYRTVLELLRGNRDFELLSLHTISMTIIRPPHFKHISHKYSELEQPDPSQFFWDNSSKAISSDNSPITRITVDSDRLVRRRG